MAAAISMSMAREQIHSWLHDEETMVTAQKIQQECFGETETGDETCLSRREGSFLLRDLYEKDPGAYVATVCVAETTTTKATRGGDNNNDNDAIKKTVFACVKLSPSSHQTKPSATATTTILALSKSTQEPFEEAFDASHERDMGVLRDRLFSKNDSDPSWFYKNSELSHIGASPNLGTMDTKPAAPVEKTWHKYEREGAFVRNSNPNANATTNPTKKTKHAFAASSNNTSTNSNSNSHSNSNSNASKPTASKAGMTRVKPTTARSFFSKKPAAKAPAKKAEKPTSTKTSTTKPPKATTKKAVSEEESATKPAFSKRVRRSSSNDKDAEEEQENNATHANDANDANIGNADDFVGDEDENSDDEQEMVEHIEKSREIVRKQNERDEKLDALGREEDHDHEEEQPRLVKGAMDAFAVRAKKSDAANANANGASGSGKKRRKVLKEKTTVNAQGFLVTTTEAIWEEISDDETNDRGSGGATKKQPSAARRPLSSSVGQARKKKTAAKKPSGMKQGSLMGFFAVKKPK